MVGVRPEVEACSGIAAKRGRETSDEVLRLDESDLLAVFRQREPSGETADPATDDDRVRQRCLLRDESRETKCR